MRPTRRTVIACLGIFAAVVVVIAVALSVAPVRNALNPVVVQVRGERSVHDRLAEFSDARARMRGHCDRAGVAYPPKRVVLLGLKEERQLHVYAAARTGDDNLRKVATYPILAASGVAGPKLREGDKQVPEGVYAVELLNPNSRFHVSMRVGYPNELDRRIARQEERTNLGGDIMIHGGAASIGCLAMGDPAAEDLFVLVAETGIENTTVILAPFDVRRRNVPAELDSGWRRELYADLCTRVAELPG